eukprot:Seg2516.4 transcript_id=Seg2516.4/GoldUCD/mRNA.D3Y31 product="hypothetical protein" protein_id=Seg2516.4/GoldUCD/D3Y31
MKLKPKATDSAIEGLLMFKANKTADWRVNLSEEKRAKMMEVARKSKKIQREKYINIKEKVLKERAKKNVDKLEEKQRKQRELHTLKENLHSKVEKVGLWKTQSEVREKLEETQGVNNKREMLWLQIRFRLKVMGASHEDRNVFQQRSGGKPYSVEQMATNLVEIIKSGERDGTVTESISEREKVLLERKRNYWRKVQQEKGKKYQINGKRERSQNLAKKRKIGKECAKSVPIVSCAKDSVGKRICQRFANAEGQESWYYEAVLSGEPGGNPSFEVRYDDEDEKVYKYRLMEDFDNEDIQLVPITEDDLIGATIMHMYTDSLTGVDKDRPVTPQLCNQAATLQSFEEYRKSKGSQWKSRVSKKEKKERSDDVVITIGLMQWSCGFVKLKPKRGQRIALRVNVKDPYMNILEKAKTKWKAYYSDTYKEDEEYVLSYSDGKSAQFLPGTCQFFDLQEYKKETGKDFKRIVLFLCTLEDHLLSESGGAALDDLEVDYGPPGKLGRIDDDEFHMDDHSFFGTVEVQSQLSVDECKTEVLPLQGPSTEVLPLQGPSTEVLPLQGPSSEVLPLQGPSSARVVETELLPIQVLPSAAKDIPSYKEKVQNISVQPSLEDIPDLEMQMKLKELLDAESETEFQSLMDSFPKRYMCGVTRMHVNYSDRDVLIEDIAQHFCLSLCNEEIQEVRKGLDLLGLLRVLEEHYEESKLEFLLSSKDTASNITSLYTNIEYSEGTEKEAEEDIYYNFTNFLEKLEHEGSMHLMKIELNEDGSETETTKEISLQEVAQFCTGSRFITHEMKGKGTISFDIARKYGTVVVNTCSVGLTFPVSERYSASPEAFIESFTEDMRTGSGFGLV